MTDLNAIKARLHSISPTAMSKLPKAVQTLLKEDLPRFIRVTGVALRSPCRHSVAYKGLDDCDLCKELLSFLPPTPEQQIKDMPW